MAGQSGATFCAGAGFVEAPVGEDVPITADEALATAGACCRAAVFVVDVAGIGVVEAVGAGDPTRP